ncbi:hypothetical protein [Carboxydothermus ferrireducens]|uniref:Uncharacterized protein n=1 Tax=Carboxydothermus ferrireducens DSM 11255 TaxID=1119529 RepID=A0ABX2RBP6_9THEO|nr:hypothetical protein [Carboxydothermus ferrireducens]NYE57218.1 hypothetical protein [Carboxydothermus ferrireducens DSM 11255]
MRVEFKKVENKTAEENLKKIFRKLVETVLSDYKEIEKDKEKKREAI